jgi:hypothetical protein
MGDESSDAKPIVVIDDEFVGTVYMDDAEIYVNDRHVIGNRLIVCGKHNKVKGNDNVVNGDNNKCTGRRVEITGMNNALEGDDFNVFGDFNTIHGGFGKIVGSGNTICGIEVTIQGNDNYILGSVTSVSGTDNNLNGKDYEEVADPVAAPVADPVADSNDEIPKCTICLTAKPNVRLDPCGHASFCHECVCVLSRTTTCPICRTPVRQAQKFYL